MWAFWVDSSHYKRQKPKSRSWQWWSYQVYAGMQYVRQGTCLFASFHGEGHSVVFVSVMSSDHQARTAHVAPASWNSYQHTITDIVYTMLIHYLLQMGCWNWKKRKCGSRSFSLDSQAIFVYSLHRASVDVGPTAYNIGNVTMFTVKIR